VQFNSLEFLFGFLPLFLAVYYVVRECFRGFVLLAGSFLFYALASGDNWWWTALLAALTLVGYYSTISVKKLRFGWLLAFWLILDAGILVFFKLYAGGRYLPAGMSFYLFQIAAIMIDVYRGRVRAEKHIINYMNQVVMFPKLLSGPIADPVALRRQERRWQLSGSLFSRGLQDFILGLSLKVLIANRLGGIWVQANVLSFADISTVYCWIALFAWSMQLYFDFYGYSLMAKGLGGMLGYDLPDNFLTPYAASSVSDFYRRWHVTLGAWFREYLYIPLGGNRKGFVRTILNLAVVWLFTGLWHGVGGNYLLWAGFLFFCVVNERIWLRWVLDRIGFLRHFYVVFAILLSWVPFAIGDFGQMTVFLTKLFGGGSCINPLDFLSLREFAPMLLAAAVFATPLPKYFWEKIRSHWVSSAILLVLFWVCVYFISTAAQDPFLYFQF